MLVLKITMLEGRSRAQKEVLIHRLSEAAASHLNCALEDVRVVIYEVSKHEWGTAGRSMFKREEQNR